MMPKRSKMGKQAVSQQSRKSLFSCQRPTWHQECPTRKGHGDTQLYQGPAKAKTRLQTLTDSDPLSSLFSGA